MREVVSRMRKEIGKRRIGQVCRKSAGIRRGGGEVKRIKLI
jgi:hypothetical protein